MAFEQDWSHRASRDLKRIVDYHDARDPDWTDVIVAAIIEKLDSLSVNPYLSSIYSETPWGEVREALAGSYRIFFVIQEAENVIQVRCIQHVRQQEPDLPE
jgi:plasmid stabilization system protein ParE